VDTEKNNDQMNVRLEKIQRIKELGHHPFADRYETTHSIGEARNLPEGAEHIRLAGRVVSMRKMGNLIFAHLFGYEGRIQFALQKKILGEPFKDFKKVVDIGDFVGLAGEIILTKTGEKTLNVKEWTFLSKALRPQPEKFHGLSDSELKLRRRYLELISNPSVMQRFKTRSRIIATIRNFLDKHDFVEIDTPVLTNKASGAMARPFVTHNNALDIDVYLRIAPETYLKRAAAGGFEKVYEFARSFRNEGVDASHLPDFTLLEYYASYWNYEDNMNFTETLMKHLVKTITGGYIIEYDGQKIDFDGSWPRVSFRDLILRDCGIDIYECSTREAVLEAMKAKGIRLDDDADIDSAGRGTLIDLLYKKVSRPSIVDPLFIIKHPLDLSPLARQSDDNEKETDRFQLVINGWEVINAYSELVDPVDQRKRFEVQAAAREAGDEDAMAVDEDFVTCMEYGMPPMSGWGMGIDRIVALLTDARTLRDVVLFPLLRPEE
jgi:lysyl-tRNA synthetase class 2